MSQHGGVTASMQMEDPEEARMSLTLTMRLRDWIELRGRLSGQGYPAWAVSASISELIDLAQARLCCSKGAEE